MYKFKLNLNLYTPQLFFIGFFKFIFIFLFIFYLKLKINCIIIFTNVINFISFFLIMFYIYYIIILYYGNFKFLIFLSNKFNIQHSNEHLFKSKKF